MTDGISISEGGYTAVSSDSLRDAANRALAVASLLRESVDAGTRASNNLACTSVWLPTAETVAEILGLAATIAQLIEVFAAQIMRAADVYEAVELIITTNMHGATPATDQRLQELDEMRPGLLESALTIAFLAGGLRNYASLDVLPRTGKEVYIADRKVTTTTDVKSVAPKGAADLAKAIPKGKAQIRIDTYTMRDGSKRYLLSASGTRAVTSPTEPFDMNANIALYTGHDSTSAEAIRRAIEDAGIEPGDWLLMNTHSQAAMIADRLAPDPAIAPDMVVTWGDPSERPMPPDVVNIDIKHTNDPVGWLGGPEYPVPTGHESSFEVSRDTNAGRPGATVSDTIRSHFLDAYIETGTMMDASQDPRMDTMRDALAELAEAESVTTTEYTFVEGTAPEPSARRNAEISTSLGTLFGNEPSFEFSDPVAPDRLGIAPPPEPQPPTFEFGERPAPWPGEDPIESVGVGGVDAPSLVNDNHAGPWRV